ncbi:CAAX prenyl protease [Savitreella phatthalungensis]
MDTAADAVAAAAAAAAGGTAADVDVLQLRVGQAAGYSVAFTGVYVGLLYAVRGARARPGRSKDHPGVIWRRIWLSLLACAISAALLVHLAGRRAESFISAIVRLTGLQLDLGDVANSLSLAAVLFAGPLYEALVSGWLAPTSVMGELVSPAGLRNYVFGPVTEEFVFRGCIGAVHLLAGVTRPRVIMLTPLYFGLAHVHKVYERVRTYGLRALPQALVVAAVQLGYTSIFGWLASFLLLRTGSIWPAVAVHAFCNAMGLPRVSGLVRNSYFHSAIYYVLLLAGALAFAFAAPHVAGKRSFDPLRPA